MKKILFTILALGFSLIVLSGCQTREDSSDWLQGDWYSKDWTGLECNLHYHYAK